MDICGLHMNHLIEHAWWRSGVGNDLDRKLLLATLMRTNSVDLLIAPIEYCCCRMVTKLLFIAIGIGYLAYFFLATNIQLFQGYFPQAVKGSIKFSSFRSTFGTVPAVASLDFLTDCNHSKYDNSSESTIIHGFTMKLNSTFSCADKFFFTIESTGKVIGSSSLRWTSNEIRFIDLGVDACSDTIRLTYEPPWPWYFGDESLIFLSLTSASFLAAGFGILFNAYSVTKHIISLLVMTLTVVTLTSFVGFMSIAARKEALYPCLLSIGFSLMLFTLLTSERSIVDRLPFLGMWFLTSRVLNDTVVFADPDYLRCYPPVLPCTLVVVGAYLAWNKRVLTHRISAGIARDRPAFDAAWDDVKGSDESAAALARISALADAMNRCCEVDAHGSVLLQRCRPKQADARGSDLWAQPGTTTTVDSEGWHRPDRKPGQAARPAASWIGRGPPTARVTEMGPPVTSLDQLYSQAMLAAPTLLSLCRQWADLSAGRLDHDPGPDPWAGGAGGAAEAESLPPLLRQLVRARAVKPPAAAAAKAAACYGGEAARLLDVCRCRIVCDSAAGVARALAAVAGSPAARVVRVRNGLCDAHDPWAAGGFRAVVVLLRLDSDDARRLSVETLVCELQVCGSDACVGRDGVCVRDM